MRWIRNCKLPVVPGSTWGSSTLMFFMRHAFDVGGWTTSDDSDAAWANANNLVLDQAAGVDGFTVAAASPRRITHQKTVGGFTQAMADDGMVMSLRGTTNDQNYSMWQIVNYVDANNIDVDPLGFSPDGWADETNMAGRVLDFGAANLTNGAWVEADPPGGNNRARMVLNLSNYIECYAQPRAGLGLFTNTPGSNLCQIYDNADTDMVFNAVFDSNNALFWKFDGGDNLNEWVMWGELDDIAPQDDFPGFLLCRGSAVVDYMIHQTYCYMLGATVYGAIEAHPDAISGTEYNDSNDSVNMDVYIGRRLINGNPGFARVRKVWVTLDDIAVEGAFTRGSLPLIRATHQDNPEYSPIDAGGEWWHLNKGVVFPRNGPLDNVMRRK